MTGPALPRRPRDLTIVIAVVFALVYALFIHTRAYSSNDASRMATIESLVERSTWAIDDSPFATVDRIKVGDHFYSDKPPILSFLGAGFYSILRHSFNLILQPWGCAPERMPTWCLAVLETNEADWAYFAITFVLVSLPTTLMLVLIYRLARRYAFSQWGSLLFVIVLGLGTALFPYSTVLNNHVPAAASMLVAFYLLMTSERPSRARLAIAGLAAALAVTIDPSTVLFAAALAVYIATRYRSDVIGFALGGIVPIGVTIILDYQILGSPVLPYMVPQGYAYAGSKLYSTVAGTHQAADVPRYAFELLLGERGFVMFYPIVVWYLYAALHALRSSDTTIRRLAWAINFGSVVYVLYVVLNTDNFGGYSYSPRWLLNPLPLLAMLAVTDRAIYGPRWRIGLVGGLSILSIVSAFYGALNPWSPAFPMLRVETTAPQPVDQPAVAMSGYSNFNDIPSNFRKTLGANNIVPRRFDARRGLVIPNETTWYFIDKSTPLAPELAGPLGLAMPTTYALNVDLSPIVRAWLKTFDTTVFLPQTPGTTTLPITFGGEAAVLGYRVQQQADELKVITAWRIETPRDYRDQRRVVIELSAPDGDTAQQNQLMAARYSSLQPGDVLLQVQQLSLNAVANGTYWLQIGVLNLQTNERLKMPDGTDRLRLTSIDK